MYITKEKENLWTSENVAMQDSKKGRNQTTLKFLKAPPLNKKQ